MKLVICFLVLVSSIGQSFGQDNSIQFDNKVTYKIPSQKKGTIDTLAISYSANGNYLYTDGRFLAQDFGLDVFGKQANKNNSRIGILYESETNQFILNYQMDESVMFMKMNLTDIAARGNDNQFDEDIDLIINDAGKLEYLGDMYDSITITPSKNIDQIITLIFDGSVQQENNKFLKSLINAITGGNISTSVDGFSFPNGLILAILDPQGNFIIEGINVERTPSELEFSHIFKIKE